MSTVKFRGVIIRETHIKEADKILTIFSKEYGKIEVGAKGAKNTKSKFLVAQLFSYCDFVAYQGKHFYSLTQVDLIESFYALRLDYERLEVGYQMIKQIDRWAIGSLLPEENQDLLALLLRSLLKLCKTIDDFELVFLVFGFKFLQITGFSPEEESFKLSSTADFTLNYIFTSEISKIFNFTLEKNVVKELALLYNKLLPLLDLR